METLSRLIESISLLPSEPIKKKKSRDFVRLACYCVNANNVQRNLSSYVPFAFDVYHREGRCAIDNSDGIVRVDSGVDNATPVDTQFRGREIMKFAVDEANGD